MSERLQVPRIIQVSCHSHDEILLTSTLSSFTPALFAIVVLSIASSAAVGSASASTSNATETETVSSVVGANDGLGVVGLNEGRKVGAETETASSVVGANDGLGVVGLNEGRKVGAEVLLPCML